MRLQFNNINIAHIRIDLYESSGMRQSGIICLKDKLDKNYIKTWKTFAPGKFVAVDYRKDIRDSNGKTPYYVVHYELNGLKLKALIRKLIELQDNNAPEDTKRLLKSRYTDIKSSKGDYAVIKITCDDGYTGWASDDGTSIIDLSHELTPGDFFIEKEKTEHMQENVLF